MIVEPIGLFARQSTDTLATENADVAAALRYIRDHAADGITVADVLSHRPVARRTLEIEFRNLLGRGIGEQIMRTRLHMARKLLLQTSLTLPEIAAHCGFKYPSHLSARFKRETGHSPLRFRRSQKG